MKFSEKLIALRKARKLSQPEIAKQIGNHWRTYQNYESGVSEPRLSTLIALADFYGISLDELACREPQER